MCMSRFEHSVHVRELEHSFKSAQGPVETPRWIVAFGRLLAKLKRPVVTPQIIPAE